MNIGQEMVNRLLEPNVNHDKTVGLRSNYSRRKLLTGRHHETVPVRAQNNQRQLPARRVFVDNLNTGPPSRAHQNQPFCHRNQRPLDFPTHPWNPVVATS